MVFQGGDEFGQVPVTLDVSEALLGLPVRRTQTGHEQRAAPERITIGHPERLPRRVQNAVRAKQLSVRLTSLFSL